MKKREALLGILVAVSLILTLSVVVAAEDDQVAKAYKCLYEKIDNKTCSAMSVEEEIFALLSSGKCKSELLEKSYNEKCWPTTNCNLEKTAKATLALETAGLNTELPKNWLLSKKGISTDLNWYLQLDSNQEISCKAIYGDPLEEHAFSINEDKEISEDAGSCFTRANNNYWFAISKNCYDKEFQITCDGTFISTLVFREDGSQTYHISREVQSSSEDSIVARLNSYCFLGSEGSCDHLGSLWAAMVLDNLDEDITDFLPYLSLSAPNYESAFPEPFLYVLTGSAEEKTDLLKKQSLNKYWEIPGSVGKYYDTALALLPFQGETLEQKENTKEWLFSVQQENGCWDNNNIVSNAFILYSLWASASGNENTGGGSEDILCSEVGYTCVEDSESCLGTTKPQYLCASEKICCDDSSTGGDELTECETAGYSCEYSSTCTGAGGQLLNDYACGATIKKCCDSAPVSTTCSEYGGEICSYDEICEDGSTVTSGDLSYGEKCCLGPGSCVSKDTGYTCETNLGYCGSACDSGYEETGDYTCESSADVCCMPKENPKRYAWLWILLVLIVLTTLAILYREKIKEVFQKMKARRSRGGSSSNSERGVPPRFPPGYNRSPSVSRPLPRKILPRPLPPTRPMPKKRSPQELDEVLRKLKEIGR